MTDLIKRDDVLAAIDTFKRDFEQSWKVQFSADIKALPAINPADRIKELEERNKELTLQLLATSGQAADALDKLTECEARLSKAVETIRELMYKYEYPQEQWKTRAVLAELEK